MMYAIKLDLSKTNTYMYKCMHIHKHSTEKRRSMGERERNNHKHKNKCIFSFMTWLLFSGCPSSLTCLNHIPPQDLLRPCS